MPTTSLYPILIVALVLAMLAAGCRASRAGYETAPYEVVRTDGAFEVRDYPSLLVAETPMRTSHDSFGRLFRYISGANSATQKIAMTTPVFMSRTDTNATMAFVLPHKLTRATAPRPTGADVAVTTMPGGRFAVWRFRGWRHDRNEAAALAQLNARLEQEGLAATGQPIFGYFDPPWTLPFLRRNEVMLRLANGP